MPLKELDTAPELRDNPSLKDFNDVTALAKSFIDTKAHVGSSIRPPGPDASAEAKKDFYDKLVKHAPHLVPLTDGDAEAEKIVWNKLGRPTDPKEYDFKPPEDTPVDVEALRAAAVKLGLTKAQFKAASEAAVENTRKSNDSTKADRDALKTEWGQAYQPKLAAAAATAAKLKAPESVIKAITEGKLSSAQLKLWDNITSAMGGEGTQIGKQQGGAGAGVPTPAEAEQQIQEIMARPEYFSRNSPERPRLIAKVLELQKLITPEVTTA